MASTAFMCFAGTEISNHARSYAYANNGLKPHTMTVRDCGCEDLAGMLGHQPYRRPDLDPNAPGWVDPLEPDSYEFGGLIITRVEGLDAAPVDRPLTKRLGDGAVAGRRRYDARTIVVTGLLIGSSCCGIEYGMRWLNAVLAGSLSCSDNSCGGDDLRYLSCCPEVCEDAPGFVSAADCAAPYWRTLSDVVLVSAPQVIGEIGGACGCCAGCPAKEVTFTLGANLPHALRDPVNVVECRTWEGAEPGECITWVTDEDCQSEQAFCESQQLEPCPLDPDCPLDVVPDLPLPANDCLCEPLAGRSRVCVDIPAATAPSWFDAVPTITFFAGALPLKQARIRIYPNPLGRELAQLDPCSFCTEINVSYLPPGATLTIDGARQAGIVQCPGRAPTSASSILSGAYGAPLSWPVIECGTPYLVCVEADAASIAPDACFSISTRVREA